MQLSSDAEIVHALNDAASSSTTNQNSSVIDTDGFSALMVCMEVTAHSVNAKVTLKVTHGDKEDGSDQADIDNAAVEATSAKANDLKGLKLCIDVGAPHKRYIRITRTTSTAVATLSAVPAVLYGAREARASTATMKKVAAGTNT